MFTNKTGVNIKEGSPAWNIAELLMAMLSESEQEKFCSRLEGYTEGIEYATRKQMLEQGH